MTPTSLMARPSGPGSGAGKPPQPGGPSFFWAAQARAGLETVAAVYAIAPHERTPEDVADGTKRAPAPKPIGKRVWASIAKPVETVVDEAFEEARRQDRDGVNSANGDDRGNLVGSVLARNEFAVRRAGAPGGTPADKAALPRA